MTAEAREHADMDFSIGPERFEALQQGKMTQNEEMAVERRGSSAVKGESEQHKSPKMLRHISGSIRRKMKS